MSAVPRRRPSLGFAVLWLALPCSIAPAAGAEPPALAPRAPAARVLAPCGGTGPETLEIVVAPAAAPSGPALRRAVCDWFRDDRWRVRWVSPAPLPERRLDVLRVVIDPTSSGGVRLNGEGPRGRWMHELPVPTELDDTGVEAVAEALHSTAQAEIAPPLMPRRPRASEPAPAPTLPSRPPLAASTARDEPLANRPSRVSSRPQTTTAPPLRPDIQPAPRAPVARAPGGERPTPAAPRPALAGELLRVHTALGYLAYARGPEPLLHGPSLHLELDALPRGVTLGASFRASLLTSATRRTLGFDVRTSGVSLSLGAAASVPVAGLTARAGLGAGVDWLALSVRVRDAELVRRVPERTSSPRFFAGLEAGVRHRFGAFELSADALLRFLPVNTPYQVLADDRPITLLEPWQLQPGASLDLGYVW